MTEKLDFRLFSLKEDAIRSSVIEAIRSAPFLALCYADVCDRDKLSAFVRCFFQRIPKNQETVQLRWSIRILLCHLGVKTEDDLTKEFAFDDLKTKAAEVAKHILPYVTIHKDINDKLALNLGFYLVLLEEKFRGIFYSVLPDLQELMQEVRIDRIYKTVGQNSFSLFMKMPLGFVETLSDFDYRTEELMKFFGFPVNFWDFEFTRALQIRIAKPYAYPAEFPHVGGLFSLVNTALVEERPFWDIVAEAIITAFGNLDLEALKVQLLHFPHVVPYIIVANQPILYGDLAVYVDFLRSMGAFAQETSPAWATIDRFCVDSDLVTLLSEITGNVLCPSELERNSVPYHLIGFEDQYKQVLAMSDMRCFSVDDQSMSNDRDFMRAYSAFRLFLGCWKRNESEINEELKEIEALLKGIRHDVTQKLVLLDIFSLIFLQDQQQNFLCPPRVAQKMVRILCKFDVPEYVYGAAARFSKHKPGRSDTTIAPWFDKGTNLTDIYNTIIEQNWDLARQMTQYLPNLRLFCNRAYAVNELITKDIAPSDPTIKLDAGLSIFGGNRFLKGTGRRAAKYSSIINKRIAHSGDSMLSPFTDSDQWEPVMEFVEGLNTNEDLIESLARDSKQRNVMISTLKGCKSLYGFMNYLSLFYECSRLSDSIQCGSLVDCFTCSLLTAFTGAFNAEQYQLCEQLAQNIGVDFLTYLLGHADAIHVPQSYLDKLAEDHPLEAATLAIRESLTLNSVKPHLKQVIHACEWTKVKTSDDIDVQICLSCDIDELDDYLFRVDHRQLYDRLMKMSHQKLTRDDRAFLVLSLVKYTAPDADLPKLVLLEKLRQVQRYTHATTPTQIITDLYNANNFGLCLEYLRDCVDRSSLASPLCHLFAMCLGDEVKVNRIMNAFPDKYDIILYKFININSVLRMLLHFIPKDKYQHYLGLSLLPEEICENSNLFEVDTIVTAYQTHRSYIFDITKEIAFIFNDQQLLSIIKSVPTNTNEFQLVIRHLFPFFRESKVIVDFVVCDLRDTIQSMAVRSNGSEWDDLMYFNRIRTLVHSFSSIDSRMKRIDAITVVVNEMPFAKRGIVYEFADIFGDNLGLYLLGICWRLDLCDSQLEKVASAFGVTLTDYYMRRFMILVEVGGFSPALKELVDKHLKIDTLDAKFYDQTFPPLQPLIKLSPFDKSFVRDANSRSCTLPELHCYEKLSKLCKSKFRPDTEALNNVKTLVMNYASTEHAMSMLVSLKFYEEAYALLMNMDDESEQRNAFIWSFYFASVITNDLAHLTREMRRLDPELTSTTDL